jgi:tetratricopeptide (TPR) repeat protein
MKKTILFIAIILICSFFCFGQSDSENQERKNLSETNIEIVKLFNQKKYDEALPLARKAVLIAEKAYGKKHLETGIALKNLGYILYLKENLKEAVDVMEDSFKIFETVANLSKDEGFSTAKILGIIASIKSQENLLDSKKYYELALEWHQKYGEENSFEVVAIISSIANINYWEKDFKEAAELYTQAIEKAASNSKINKDQFDIILDRGECSYRKADKLEEFEEIGKKFAPNRNKNSDTIDKKSPGKITKGVVNGSAISLPIPAYPSEARSKRASGEVKVRVTIDENGRVLTACAENKKDISLLFASELAAYRSRFKPTTLEGKPVKVSGIIVYDFIP